MRRGRLASAALAAALVVAIPGTASAAWSLAGLDDGSAHATSMPVGATPSVSVTGRSVELTWAERSFGDGTAVAGYRVTRYDTSGDAHVATGGCAGTIALLTCTEDAVPAGTWRYTVRTVQAQWSGAEGPQSAPAVVAPPALTWDAAATITSLPAVLDGDVDAFVAGESVVFRLDDPDTGTLLAGSIAPSPIPASGQAAVSVTVPNGTTDGTHDVYAVGDEGTVAVASITVDRTAPVVTAATIAKASGGVDGAIRQGGSYHVYANVSDPVSGAASVTANVSNVTTGATAANLVAGSYTVDGVTYGYRSAATTANATLAAGSKSFTVAATDAAGNASAPASFSVVVDNTAPSGADVETVNGGATVGKAEAGDVVSFIFSEPIEPASLLTAWNGSSTSVTVRIVNAAGSDQLQVWDAANGTQLTAFGSVRLASTGYVTATVSFSGSTAVVSGNTVAITLGTPSGATGTDTGNARMRWTTDAGATDVAGNACSAGNVNEGGTNDANF